MRTSERRIKVEKPCRQCKCVPEGGYFISRAIRNDWICPDCSNKNLVEKRKEKRKQIMEEIENEKIED